MASGSLLEGFSWLPDGSGFVYSSSRGSTLLYPPVFNLRTVRRRWQRRPAVDVRRPVLRRARHSRDRASWSPAGSASRSDIWKFPVTGTPAENTRGGVRDHAADRSGAGALSQSRRSRGRLRVRYRRLHEPLDCANRRFRHSSDHVRDGSEVAIGVPVWSPRGDWIAFVRSDAVKAATWGIRPDGTGLRRLVRDGRRPGPPTAVGSTTGGSRSNLARIERIPIDGGAVGIVAGRHGVFVVTLRRTGRRCSSRGRSTSTFSRIWGAGFAEYVRAHPLTDLTRR